MKSFEHVMVGVWYLALCLMRILASTTGCHHAISVWASHDEQHIHHFCRTITNHHQHQQYSIQCFLPYHRLEFFNFLQLQLHPILEPWLAVAFTISMESAAWRRFLVLGDFYNLVTSGQQLSDYHQHRNHHPTTMISLIWLRHWLVSKRNFIKLNWPTNKVVPLLVIRPQIPTLLWRLINMTLKLYWLMVW